MPSSKPVSQRDIPKSVPLAEVEHFSSNPLAQSTLADPNFHMYSMSRTITHGGKGHTLMAGTWNTDETIAHLLSFYRQPTAPGTAFSDVNNRAEVRRFYTFGSGLNAHPDLLHGGVIACILDSTMGNVIGFALPELAHERNGSMFTVQLNVKYEKPVRTPGTVMARSWVKKVEEGGRKVWVEGVIQGGDGGEIGHARAEGLWVTGGGKKEGKL